MKENLIHVFIDTLAQSQALASNSITKSYNLNDLQPIADLGYSPHIQTLDLDTVSAAQKYAKLGKTCLLNMASPKRPGGGVANGAQAQEECLFRCSNLATTVTPNFYPLDQTTALYTTEAIFFKDRNYQPIVPFTVDVVTIPAVNLNTAYHGETVASYDQIMKDKIRLMLNLAYQHQCTNLILGAWGCGVFKNNPLDIAELFSEVIYEQESKIAPSYFDCFENIIFAVINDHNSVADNFSVFSSIFP